MSSMRRAGVTISVLFLLVVLTLFLALPALSAPFTGGRADVLSQVTPRPTWDIRTPGPPGGGGDGVPSKPLGASLHGTVINWAFRNEPKSRVRLDGGGWSLEALSDDNGFFGFNDLGQGVGVLNPLLVESGGLLPMTRDVAVPLVPPGDLVVNLGLYSGHKPPENLPVSHTMMVEPAVTTPGSMAVYTVRVKNDRPDPISQVMVTDYLPKGLYFVKGSASRGEVSSHGDLVVADIGQMEAGGEVVVTIEMQVSSGATEGTVIENRASLIYAESVAIQAVASLTVESKPPAPSSSSRKEEVATPTVDDPPRSQSTPTSEAEEESAVTKTATVVAYSPGSSDERLPTTGFGLPLAGGVILALLVLLFRKIRAA